MDVEKRKVFDSRLVQKTPCYAINKGAMSCVDASFPASSATTDQHIFDIRVPNENTIVDRAVTWSSRVGLGVTFSSAQPVQIAYETSGGNPPISFSVSLGTRMFNAVYPGANYSDSMWGFCASPLQSMTSSIQATINDTTVQIQTKDVLKEVLRLVDKRGNRLSRTSPSKLDICASAVQDSGLINGVYGSYSMNATDADEVPNSAFWISGNDPLNKVNPYVNNVNGTPLGNGGITIPPPIISQNGSVVYNGSEFQFKASLSLNDPSIPIPSDWTIVLDTLQLTQSGVATIGMTFNSPSSIAPAIVDGYVTFSLTLYTAPYFTEKLVLSPFVFNEVPENDTGLFGVKNIQLAMKLQDPQVPRIIRQRNSYPIHSGFFNDTPVILITSAYAPVFNGRVFEGSEVSVEFLTPSLDLLPLPKKSIVPYTDYNCYKTNTSSQLTGYSAGTYTTNTITLSQVPDYLLVYAKSSETRSSIDTDFYLPLNNVSLQWGNNAGMLSSYSQTQLYNISVKNGLRQDYQQWAGRFGGNPVLPNGQEIIVSEAVGGFVLLRPGKDFALPVGEAPGVVGKYTLKVTMGVNNTGPNTHSVELDVIAVNSGFFESSKGTSRVIKGIIDERDVVSSPEGSAPERVVGGRKRK